MAGRARVVFLGNDAWSVPSLEAVAGRDDIDVLLVITAPPRPAGRGSPLRPTAVASSARQLGLPLDETDSSATRRPSTGCERSPRTCSSSWRSVGCSRATSSGCRPAGRSTCTSPCCRAGVARARSSTRSWPAIRRRASRSCASTKGSTQARSFDRRSLRSNPTRMRGRSARDSPWPAVSCWSRRSREWSPGAIDATPQAGEPTYAPKLTSADRRLDWKAAADAIVRRIRAFAPDPGATTALRGRVFKVFRAEVAPSVPGDPGTISSSANGVLVSAGSEGVRLIDVAPAGRRRMPAVDWARGAHLAAGERFD